MKYPLGGTRGYQCRLRRRGGLCNRNRIDARSHNFIDRTEERDVGGGSVNVVQNIMVNLENMARHRGRGSCGESTHMWHDISLRCMNYSVRSIGMATVMRECVVYWYSIQ
jgi:hypothetical protein